MDGTAELVELLGGQTKTARFRAAEELGRYVIEKGSVALDGVSLTVAGVEDGPGECRFSVGLIPETLRNCTLSRIEPGESVNVETDIVGKYIERFLRFGKNEKTAGPSGKKNSGLTLEELYNLGY